jgi:hypothetical protein
MKKENESSRSRPSRNLDGIIFHGKKNNKNLPGIPLIKNGQMNDANAKALRDAVKKAYDVRDSIPDSDGDYMKDILKRWYDNSSDVWGYNTRYWMEDSYLLFFGELPEDYSIAFDHLMDDLKDIIEGHSIF